MTKKFKSEVSIEVEDGANFWEVDGAYQEAIISQLIIDSMYDIDDLEVKHVYTTMED